MKVHCGETHAEKWKRLGEWHPWFAWYPVRIAPGDCRWLEFVARRMFREDTIYDTWITKEYHAIK
jgi:hypothetical protein